MIKKYSLVTLIMIIALLAFCTSCEDTSKSSEIPQGKLSNIKVLDDIGVAANSYLQEEKTPSAFSHNPFLFCRGQRTSNAFFFFFFNPSTGKITGPAANLRVTFEVSQEFSIVGTQPSNSHTDSNGFISVILDHVNYSADIGAAFITAIGHFEDLGGGRRPFIVTGAGTVVGVKAMTVDEQEVTAGDVVTFTIKTSPSGFERFTFITFPLGIDFEGVSASNGTIKIKFLTAGDHLITGRVCLSDPGFSILLKVNPSKVDFILIGPDPIILKPKESVTLQAFGFKLKNPDDTKPNFLLDPTDTNAKQFLSVNYIPVGTVAVKWGKRGSIGTLPSNAFELTPSLSDPSKATVKALAVKDKNGNVILGTHNTGIIATLLENETITDKNAITIYDFGFEREISGSRTISFSIPKFIPVFLRPTLKISLTGSGKYPNAAVVDDKWAITSDTPNDPTFFGKTSFSDTKALSEVKVVFRVLNVKTYKIKIKIDRKIKVGTVVQSIKPLEGEKIFHSFSLRLNVQNTRTKTKFPKSPFVFRRLETNPLQWKIFPAEDPQKTPVPGIRTTPSGDIELPAGLKEVDLQELKNLFKKNGGDQYDLAIIQNLNLLFKVRLLVNRRLITVFKSTGKDKFFVDKNINDKIKNTPFGALTKQDITIGTNKKTILWKGSFQDVPGATRDIRTIREESELNFITYVGIVDSKLLNEGKKFTTRGKSKEATTMFFRAFVPAGKIFWKMTYKYNIVPKIHRGQLSFTFTFDPNSRVIDFTGTGVEKSVWLLDRLIIQFDLFRRIEKLKFVHSSKFDPNKPTF